MKLVALFLIALNANLAIASDDCRAKVVAAYGLLEKPIDADNFSTNSLADLGLSIEEINNLNPQEQAVIYDQVKPLDVVIEETIDELSSRIDQVVGTFYEFFMAEQLQQWRAQREELRVCLPERLKYLED